MNFKSQKERDAENERKKGEKEAKISEMADEIFKNAVGQIFQMPNDYTEQSMLSPKSIGGDLEEREIRRRLKAERRAKETDEERRLRKLRSANQSGA